MRERDAIAFRWFEHGAEVFQLDYSINSLMIMKRLAEEEKISVSIVGGDTFCLPFHDETFDIVFHQGLLEHFRPQQAEALLRENIRILKKGGLAACRCTSALSCIHHHKTFPHRHKQMVCRLGDGNFPSVNFAGRWNDLVCRLSTLWRVDVSQLVLPRNARSAFENRNKIAVVSDALSPVDVRAAVCPGSTP